MYRLNNSNGTGAVNKVVLQMQDTVSAGVKPSGTIVKGDEGAALEAHPKGPGAVGGKHPSGEYRLDSCGGETSCCTTGGSQGDGSNSAGRIDLILIAQGARAVVDNHIKTSK